MVCVSLLAGMALVGLAACGPSETWSEVQRRADGHLREGELPAAERDYRRALELAAARGPGDEGVAWSALALGELLWTYPDLDEEGEAEALHARALAILEGIGGADGTDALEAAAALGEIRAASGRPAEAVALLAPRLARVETQRGPEHWVWIHLARPLHEAYRGAGHADEASALAERIARRPRGTSGAAWTPPPGTYLRPNFGDWNGVAGFVHPTPEDMPLVVGLDAPPLPAADGDVEEARAAVAAGLRDWEAALRERVPWFRIEVARPPAEAAVRVEWKRKMAGPRAGFAGRRVARVAGRLRYGGWLTISTRSDVTDDAALTLAQLRELAAHEFGHVLGLRHCSCEPGESIMAPGLSRDGRYRIRPLDVATFAALLARPNGVRLDGRPFEALREEASASGMPPASATRSYRASPTDGSARPGRKISGRAAR